MKWFGNAQEMTLYCFYRGDDDESRISNLASSDYHRWYVEGIAGSTVDHEKRKEGRIAPFRVAFNFKLRPSQY